MRSGQLNFFSSLTPNDRFERGPLLGVHKHHTRETVDDVMPLDDLATTTRE
jgi:hypothetical protein